MSQIRAYDIIPSEYADEFKGIMDRPRTSLGYPVNTVTKDMVNKLHIWGITEI